MDDLRKELGHVAEETAYAAVGFAVLGFQRAQVVRRRLERIPPIGALAEQVRGVVSTIAGSGRDGGRGGPGGT